MIPNDDPLDPRVPLESQGPLKKRNIQDPRVPLEPRGPRKLWDINDPEGPLDPWDWGPQETPENSLKIILKYLRNLARKIFNVVFLFTVFIFFFFFLQSFK